MDIACQLYTLRNLVQRDFAAAAREVAKIGYRAVELAGFGNLERPSQVREVLDDLGLVVAGSHTTIELLERDLDAVLDANEILDSPAVVLSFLPEARRRDAEGWRSSAALLDRIGQACRARGLELAYHHHHFEFQQFDGRTGLDLLWQHSDPANVKAELDTFWIRYAGEDPAGYVARLGPRATHLHLKDMQAGAERRFAEVGAGTLDFPAILDAARRAGVSWGIVEQDLTYERPPLESVRLSFDNLKRLGAV